MYSAYGELKPKTEEGIVQVKGQVAHTGRQSTQLYHSACSVTVCFSPNPFIKISPIGCRSFFFKSPLLIILIEMSQPLQKKKKIPEAQR